MSWTLIPALAGITTVAIFAILRSKKRRLRTPEFALVALGILCSSLSQLATYLQQIASAQILGCTATVLFCLGAIYSFRGKKRLDDLSAVLDRQKELTQKLESAQAQLIESTESLKRSMDACIDEPDSESFATLDEGILRNAVHQLRLREATSEIDQATRELYEKLEDESD